MNRKVLIGLWISAVTLACAGGNVIAGIGMSRVKLRPSDGLLIRINLTEVVQALRWWNRTIAPEQTHPLKTRSTT